jgi:hypothetical protein
MACSRDHFDDVWEAFAATRPDTPTVRVSRVALADMIQCDMNCRAMTPLGLVVEKQRKREGETVEVYREKLWEFLSKHRCEGSLEVISMRARNTENAN